MIYSKTKHMIVNIELLRIEIIQNHDAVQLRIPSALINQQNTLS